MAIMRGLRWCIGRFVGAVPSSRRGSGESGRCSLRGTGVRGVCMIFGGMVWLGWCYEEVGLRYPMGAVLVGLVAGFRTHVVIQFRLGCSLKTECRFQ